MEYGIRFKLREFMGLTHLPRATYELIDKSHDIVDRFLYQDTVDNVELQAG